MPSATDRRTCLAQAEVEDRYSYEEGAAEVLEAIQNHYANLSAATRSVQPDSASATHRPDLEKGEKAHPDAEAVNSEGLLEDNSRTTRSNWNNDLDQSQPGAFAEAPSFPETTAPLGNESESNHTSHSTSWGSSTLNSNLVAARLVEEGPPLSQARPMSRAATESKRRWSSRHIWGLLTALLVAVAIVTVGLVARVLKNQEESKNSFLREATPSPTVSDTFLYAAEILSLLSLPEDLLLDPKTPQSQALAWMLGDPLLADYLSSHQEKVWRIPQRFALATLYYSTGGANWTNNDHWLSYQDHECKWFARAAFSYPTFFDILPNYGNAKYLPCSPEGVYHHLWLYGNQMRGSLPEDMYDGLPFLRSVSLFENQLTGTLSPKLGSLAQLEGWSMANNQFWGPLPSELGLLSTTLWYWNCHNSQLTGSIPSELGKMGFLERLIMDFNTLTGSIPTEVSGLTSLMVWYGNHNQFSGTLPTEFGLLESAVDVRLDFNSLTGTLPTELGLLQSLKGIGLVVNSLTGTLPTELGVLAANLEVLELQENRFSGTLPLEYGNLDRMTHLLLQHNRLTGTVPLELRRLWNSNVTSSLKAFNVSGNSNLLEETCWTHPTFYQTPECPWHYPPALSCWCECSC